MRVAVIRAFNRVLPLRYRYRAILGRVPPGSLLETPWCDGKLVVPADWLDAYSLFRLVAEGERSMPELALAGDLLAQAGPGAIIDVGAHAGQFVLWARQHSDRKILAFEPDPFARAVLDRMIDENGLRDVRVIGAACGEMAGSVPLTGARVSRIGKGSADEADRVPMVGLDEILEDEGPIALIKVDVEGFEARVLRGARAQILRGSAQFLIEIHPRLIEFYGDRIRDVVAMFAQTHDIALWQFEPGAGSGRFGRLLWRLGSIGGRRIPVSVGGFDRLREGPPQVYLTARRREALCRELSKGAEGLTS